MNRKMINNRLLFFTFFILIQTSCLHNDANIYLSSIDFNENYQILSIDYDHEPDTALQQIIYKSKVRNDGYGIILNVDQSLSENDIKKLTYDFQLQDINAVHTFNIQSGKTPDNNVLVAIEQARFVWIFSNNMYNLSGQECQPVVKAFHNAVKSDGILIIHKMLKDKLIQCLELV